MRTRRAAERARSAQLRKRNRAATTLLDTLEQTRALSAHPSVVAGEQPPAQDGGSAAWIDSVGGSVQAPSGPSWGPDDETGGST